LNDYYYSNKIIDELKSYSEYEDVLNLVKSKLAKKGLKGNDLTSIDWTEKKLSKPKVTVRIGTMFSGIGAIEYALKRLNIKTQIQFASDIDLFAKQSYFENYEIDEKRC
jgi:DNA (cytosine-5)-methyltransferase 1